MADLRKLMARLLSECAAKVAPRVRIPVSPPFQIVDFRLEMALFRNFGVNRRNRLYGVQNRPPPHNAADFLDLAENGPFLDRKLPVPLKKP